MLATNENSLHIDGFAQDCINSNANTLELPQCCAQLLVYLLSSRPVFYVLAPSLLSWAHSGVSTEQAWSLLSWSIFYLANCSLLSDCSRACPEQAPSDLMRQPNSFSVIFFDEHIYNVYFRGRRPGINNTTKCVPVLCTQWPRFLIGLPTWK